jgi:seryl-tRNA synthetase
MHDIRFIRENPEAFDRALKRRGLEPQAQRLSELDRTRRMAIQNLEEIQARRNTASKGIGDAKKNKDEKKAQGLLAEVATLKEAMPAFEANEKRTSKAFDGALAEIPNLPADDVPDGKDANDNVERSHYGKKRDYAFTPKQHFDLGEALAQMDFETAVKLSGARFVVLKKGLARLERALGQFFLDVHTSEPHNYTEVSPPLLVLDQTMFGTAQLPKFADDQFKTAVIRDRKPREDFANKIYSNTASVVETLISSGTAGTSPFTLDNSGTLQLASGTTSVMVSHFVNTAIADSAPLIVRAGLDDPELNERRWLIPTAEVPLTNLVRETIVDEKELPLRLTACTPCFRQEAGAAGKDTRGMIRQHQFTKVELVSITTPEQSKNEHERMLACAEEVLKRLDLHYRVVTLCAGDMGFAAQKTYDIEVWLPGQNMYREISSCSNCGEFQARRMSARYRAKEGRDVRPVHTLNGSGVAVGRALIAVMETYQQDDGSIAVPEALAPYMGGIKKIERS